MVNGPWKTRRGAGIDVIVCMVTREGEKYPLCQETMIPRNYRHTTGPYRMITGSRRDELRPGVVRGGLESIRGLVPSYRVPASRWLPCCFSPYRIHGLPSMYLRRL